MTLSGPNAWRGSIKDVRIFPHFLHSAVREGIQLVNLLRWSIVSFLVASQPVVPGPGWPALGEEHGLGRVTRAGVVGHGGLTRHGRRKWVVDTHLCDAGIRTGREEVCRVKEGSGGKGRRKEREKSMDRKRYGRYVCSGLL